MSGFRLDVGADEPRGHSITIEPDRDECAVTVAFMSTLEDASAPEVRAVVESLDDGWLSFTYVVKRFDIVKIMEEIRSAINHLNRFENRAFQKREVAFSDAHALAAALQPLAQIGHQLYTRLFGFGLNPDLQDIECESLHRSQWRVYGDLLRSWLERAETLHI